MSCGFALFIGVMDNHGASRTQSRLADVRGSSRRDSNGCRSFGGREPWWRNWVGFRHRLASSNVRSQRNVCEEQIHAPRRAQNQVNEGFGFEVSFDAVVLFDVRD